MRKTRLPQQTIKQLIAHFVAAASARSAAQLCDVAPNTAIKWFHRFRMIIAARLALDAPLFENEVEADESYFGGRRKGKRGRGAAGKIAVFGLYKRNGYVYAVSVENTKSYTLSNIICKKVAPDSIVYTDSYPSYNVLDASRFRHRRINHAKGFARGRVHINGIENFWRQAKRHLARYNGIPKNHFDLYLKECEWRFNYRPIARLRKNVVYLGKGGGNRAELA